MISVTQMKNDDIKGLNFCRRKILYSLLDMWRR